MRAELPSWPDTCHEVAAQIDELVARLSATHRDPLNRRQRLGRDLAITGLRRAQHTVALAAETTWTGNHEARLDGIREQLEHGEYLDPDQTDGRG